MKEFKGTPGPWALGFPKADGEGLHCPIHADTHAELATVVWQMEDDKHDAVPSLQCEANAALIASSPQLLEFVLHVKSCLNKNGEYSPLTTEYIDETIARALGE